MKHLHIGVVASVATLALGLAACAPAGSTDDSSGSPSQDTAGDAAATTTLTVWDPNLLTKKTDDGSVADNSFLNVVAKQFEDENPGIKVDIVTTSGDISKDAAQFQAASIAGNGPDIRVSFTGGNTIDYADFLQDLDGVFPDSTVSDLSGWNITRAGYKSDGQLVGLPYGAGSHFFVFYNKALAEQAGLDLSTPPATWEDLLALGQQAVGKTDADPFWITNLEGYLGAWVVAALAGGELGPDAFLDMYSGETPITDPAMVKAYQAYAQLFSLGLTNPDAGTVSNSEHLSGFVQGKAIFTIGGSWDNTDIPKAFGDDGVGVFPIPMLADAKYPKAVAGGPNVAVSITKYTKNLDAAKKFLNFLAEPEVIDQYVKLFQTEPSNSKSADQSVITNPYLKAETAFVADADADVFPFDSVMPQSVIDLFYRLDGTTFTGQTSAEDAVQQLQDAYDAEQVG